MKKQIGKSNEARAGKNGVDSLPKERLVELIDGARFTSAKTRYQTAFGKEYAERFDSHLRRRLAEEAAAESANEQSAPPRSESPQKSEPDEH